MGRLPVDKSSRRPMTFVGYVYRRRQCDVGVVWEFANIENQIDIGTGMYVYIYSKYLGTSLCYQILKFYF